MVGILSGLLSTAQQHVHFELFYHIWEAAQEVDWVKSSQGTNGNWP